MPAPQFGRLDGLIFQIKSSLASLKGIGGVTAADLGTQRVTFETLVTLQNKIATEISRVSAEVKSLNQKDSDVRSLIRATEKKIAAEGLTKLLVRMVVEIASNRASLESQIRELEAELTRLRRRVQESESRLAVLRTVEKDLRTAMASPGGKKWSGVPGVTLSKLSKLTARAAETLVATPRVGQSQRRQSSGTSSRSVFQYKDAPRANVVSCVAALKEVGLDCDPRTFEADIDRIVAGVIAHRQLDAQERNFRAALQGKASDDVARVMEQMLDDPRSRQVRLVNEAIAQVIVTHLGPWL